MLGYPSNSLLVSYDVTSGLTAGSAYQFMVRSKNIYGWSSYSTAVTIYASDVPDQVATVTTTVSGTSVRIAWSAPSDNSDSILSYNVRI